tara:strand:- start:515 stop:1984 length:1470 start_codon:yes stop_codon:yes gene_type:complete
MSNKEENIDRFVKKVISQYEVRYDETHWEALEKQLDAEMPVVPPASPLLTIPTIIMSVVGGMILMLGILWMGGTFDDDEAGELVGMNPGTEEIKNGNTEDGKRIQIAGTHNYPEPNRESGQDKEQVGSSIDQSSSERFLNTAESNDNVKSVVEIDDNERISISNQQASSNTHSGPNNLPDQVEGRGPDGLSIDDTRHDHFSNTSDLDGGVDSGDGDMILTDDEDIPFVARQVTTEQQQGGLITLPIYHTYNHDIPTSTYDILISTDPSDNRVLSSADLTPDDDVVPNNRKLFTYGIALGFSPDFNSVGMKESMEVSGQAGLQFIITFRNRLSLATGAFYGKKKFITSGENYFPPNEYWKRYTNGVIPEEVNGHIVVVDIPINLTYNWNPESRFQFISSIGVSNYFILSEDCTYKFSSYNPGTEYGWDSDEMTREMFGVGNLSVGVMWYMKPRINIRVEPYIKIPLKEVGWGSVDLYSAGSLISIQYTFN